VSARYNSNITKFSMFVGGLIAGGLSNGAGADFHYVLGFPDQLIPLDTKKDKSNSGSP